MPSSNLVARLVAASALSVGLAVSLASCTSVLNLDEYGNVADEMCTLLDRCYGKLDNLGCLPVTERHLDEASSGVRGQWLESFTSFGCLESCSAGRRCLDIPPLCLESGPCVRRQDCCGFLTGNASCVARQCCVTRGSACVADTDCCAGAGSCTEGVCGGIACLRANDACEVDAQCCTKICKDGACADTICEDDNGACTTDQDCCSQFCDPTSHVCAQPPQCGKVDEACVVDTDCCEDTSCVHPPGSLTGKCGAPTCSPVEVDCSDHGQCCSGRCDMKVYFCVPACLDTAGACTDDAGCCDGKCTAGFCAPPGLCSITTCQHDTDCCSGSCIAGVCAAGCGDAADHTPCTTGGPLASTGPAASCVASVCKGDPFCCCGGWDATCVGAAAVNMACTGSCM